MTNIMEILTTSDTSTNLWSSSVWDYKTGTNLHAYKGGGIAAHNTATFICNDYFMVADNLKPLLYVWPVNSQETVKNMRFVCPGRVSALAVSSDGCYCIAGIEEKIHVWQIASGRLLSVSSRHLQPITKIQFTCDDSHVVSCGEDGLVLIWPLVNLISHRTNDIITQVVVGQADPIYTLSDHSLPVHDIFVGKGLNGRLATVSADRTLKLYQLLSGTLLLSVVFAKRLTAVTMNVSETFVFVGSDDGDIYEFSLLNPPRNREHYLNDQSKESVFKGHSKSITCLSVSVHGQTLVSGSKDEQVIIWHILSKQKMRVLPHKGTVANAFFSLVPNNMFVHELKPTISLNAFQRSAVEESECFIDIINHKPLIIPSLNEGQLLEYTNRKPKLKIYDESNPKAQIEKLKAANRSLYEFALENLIHPPSDIAKKTKLLVKQNLKNSKKRKRQN